MSEREVSELGGRPWLRRCPAGRQGEALRLRVTSQGLSFPAVRTVSH